MKNKDIGIKSLHLRRLHSFKSFEDILPQKYFKPKIPAIIMSVTIIIVFLILFFFTNYKRIVLNIGIFAVFFSLYRVYEAYTKPCLVMNDNEIIFRNVRVGWKKIKRINTSYDLKKQKANFQILLKENIIMEQKIENFSFFDYMGLPCRIRTFKKKNRDKYFIQN
ncbi:hypothetical protein [Elizabethkingia meningoseptica]|uniref:hypothetical protein n=1 Tax=Elizabethkingia meningoseptica TaxID=238 RepID=UPI0038917D8D